MQGRENAERKGMKALNLQDPSKAEMKVKEDLNLLETLK